MKNLVFYSIASTVIGYAAQALGVGFGFSVFGALTVPPAIKLALIARSMSRSSQ